MVISQAQLQRRTLQQSVQQRQLEAQRRQAQISQVKVQLKQVQAVPSEAQIQAQVQYDDYISAKQSLDKGGLGYKSLNKRARKIYKQLEARESAFLVGAKMAQLKAEIGAPPKQPEFTGQKYKGTYVPTGSVYDAIYITPQYAKYKLSQPKTPLTPAESQALSTQAQIIRERQITPPEKLATSILEIKPPVEEKGVPIFTPEEIERAKKLFYMGQPLPKIYGVGDETGKVTYVRRLGYEDYRRGIMEKSYGEILKESPASILHKVFFEAGKGYLRIIDKQNNRILGTRLMTESELDQWGTSFGELGLFAFFAPAFQTGVTQKQIQKELSKTKFDKLSKFFDKVKSDIIKKKAGKEQIKYINELAKKENKNNNQEIESIKK